MLIDGVHNCIHNWKYELIRHRVIDKLIQMQIHCTMKA